MLGINHLANMLHPANCALATVLSSQVERASGHGQ